MSKQDCIREQPWDILCRVIRVEGVCASGHKVGDEVLVKSNEVVGKICFSALYSMIPKIYAMRYNARLPWLENQCVATHACPDAKNPVVFEVVRTEQAKEE